MKKDSYYSIKNKTEGGYKELGSRFISFAIPVSSEKAIPEILDSIRKEYHDASHHCYAYIIGNDKKVFKTHDAGEPKHTAGYPVLSQIRSMDITDVLVVVVRYFGGTKLGTGGLANAYKMAARSALQNAVRIEKTLSVNIKIQFEMDRTGEIMKLLNTCKEWILESHFEGMNRITILIRASREIEFRKKLDMIQGVTML